MTRILVLDPPEDHARRALNVAFDLARNEAAELRVLRVLEETPGWPQAEGAPTERTSLRDLLLESERRAIESAVLPLRERGIPVETEVCWGVAWDAILDRVERDRVDLVVKPAHGLSHEGRVFFGSTALHLFRKCPCPVWVVGSEGRLPIRILASIDPAIEPRRRQAAARILDWARRIAQRSEATISVVSAWNAPASGMLEGRIPAVDLEKYVHEAQEAAASALDGILLEYAPEIPRNRVHLIEGAPRDALPRFIEERGFDLVVMGTLGHSGITGDLLGETAEMIIRAVHSSVLTVPPPDIASRRT